MPPLVVVIFFLFGILQYWLIGFMWFSDFINGLSHPVVAFTTYFFHWSSVGGLIGFAVSRKGGRGTLIGAVTGAILSAIGCAF